MVRASPRRWNFCAKQTAASTPSTTGASVAKVVKYSVRTTAQWNRSSANSWT